MVRDAAAIKYFTRAMLAWYRKNGRHFPWRNKSASKYQVVIAEVLLQRTRAETVAKYFPPFVSRYSSWQKLNRATYDELKSYLQPLGLWNRRAISLKMLALDMVKRRGRYPVTRKDIEALPGVGQYIANAILMFCHGQPQPLLDVNMARVLERYFGPRRLADIRYDPYLQKLSREIIDCDEPASVNWAILDFSAKVCKANKPSCDLCVLRSSCRYCSHPVRKTKPS